jgi:hypothetical protein
MDTTDDTDTVPAGLAAWQDMGPDRRTLVAERLAAAVTGLATAIVYWQERGNDLHAIARLGLGKNLPDYPHGPVANWSIPTSLHDWLHTNSRANRELPTRPLTNTLEMENMAAHCTRAGNQAYVFAGQLRDEAARLAADLANLLGPDWSAVLGLD